MEISIQQALHASLMHLRGESIKIIRKTVDITAEQYDLTILNNWLNKQPNAPEALLNKCEQIIHASRMQTNPEEAERLKDQAITLEFQRSQAYLFRAQEEINNGKEAYSCISLIEAALILGKISVSAAVNTKYHQTLKNEQTRKSQKGGKANNERYRPTKEELWKRVKQKCEDGSKWPSIKNAIDTLQSDILAFSQNKRCRPSVTQFHKTARGWIKEMPDYEIYFHTKS